MKKMKRRELFALSGTALAALAAGARSQSNQGNQVSAQKQKIIIMGAHPDDPETGCGGLMALLAQRGHTIISAYLTRGEAGIAGKSHQEAAAIRTQEAIQACEILGAKPVFLGQIDGNCEVNKARYTDIIHFLEKEKPDALFSHWPIDTHRDHQVCSILAYDAWLRLGRMFSLYYFEVMTGQQSQNFVPTDYLNITTVLEKKHKACYIHKSQHIENGYANDHGKMESFRGLEFGCAYAEAFIHHVQSPRIIL
jgi:LmbE family N-acetylglucosaminyl deacetylase